MVRVRSPVRIIVAAGIGKVLTGARTALMNVKREKTGFRSGEPPYLCLYNQPVPVLKKTHIAADLGIVFSALDSGDCFWMRTMLHSLTPSSEYDRMLKRFPFFQ